MKKPNPVFLGVIALAALLPHTPRLLPGEVAKAGAPIEHILTVQAGSLDHQEVSISENTPLIQSSLNDLQGTPDTFAPSEAEPINLPSPGAAGEVGAATPLS